MRVVFAGTPEVAVPALDAIAASGHELVGVVTRPDAQYGRGRRLTPSPVALRAGFERAVRNAVEGADEKPGTPFREPGEQVAGGVGGPDPLGHHAVRRPGVEGLHDAERGGAGDLVAGPQ